MYFPTGWPRLYNCGTDETLLCLAYSQDKSLLAVASASCIYLWNVKPRTIVSRVRRSGLSLEQYGSNVSIHWRPDASLLAVVTSKSFVLIYDGMSDARSAPDTRVQQLEFSTPQQSTFGGVERDGVPANTLHHRNTVHIQAGITSVCPRQELLSIATAQGSIQGVRWNGVMDVDESFFLSDVELQDGTHIAEELYAVDLAFQRLHKAYGAVLTDGSVTSFTYQPHSQPIAEDDESPKEWTPVNAWGHRVDIDDGTCLAITPKYMLLAVGTKSGDIKVFSIDPTTCALTLGHVCSLKNNNAPYELSGGVSCLAWSPDSIALAAGHERCGLSVWSVFGNLLHCTIKDIFSRLDHNRSPIVQRDKLATKALEWGLEGYYLSSISLATDHERPVPGEILEFSYAKSALATNPVMANHACALLVGEDRLYFYYEGYGGKQGSWMKGNVEKLCDLPWQLYPIPSPYLSENWPIRYAAVDENLELLAVAGKCGLAIYSVLRRRWSLFGNTNQEREFRVRGGLVWWQQYLVVPCRSTAGQDLLRVYHSNRMLDTYSAHTTVLARAPVLVNVCFDYLLLLGSDRTITIYLMEEKANVFTLTELASASLSEQIPFAICATQIALSPLSSTLPEPESSTPTTPTPQSLVINVAGRLSVMDLTEPLPTGNAQPKALQISDAIVLSDGVENVWIPRKLPQGRHGMGDALFLSTRLGGMKVSLPLYSSDANVARRVILPFLLNVYPMSVFFEEGVVLGVVQEVALDVGKDQAFDFVKFEHKTQMYLHHMLRHLLRRNMQDYARLLAWRCHSLPYFAHALELMLHEVLEEESSSPMGISQDALLPQVVEFVAQFPEYLEVIAHCARKTEVALWDFLFARVGDPRTLFERCLTERRLHTASSYLVILQNLEPPAMSRQHATRLLDAALDNDQWELAKELIRFLAAIADDTQFLGLQRKHSIFCPSVEVAGIDVGGGKRTVSTQTDTLDNSEKFYVDLLLSRYARKLLTKGRIRALALFSLNLSFPLKKWLLKEKNRAARVEDYEATFKMLHQQFEWAPPEARHKPIFQVRRRFTLAANEHIGTGEAAWDDHDWTSITGRRDSIVSSDASVDAGSQHMLLRSHSAASMGLREVDDRAVSLQELRHLLDLCLVGQCHDWAALLSLMLQATVTLNAVLAAADSDADYAGGKEAMIQRLTRLVKTDIGLPYAPFLQSAVELP
eukprot:comp20653_c0_seq1/m.26793 comp20653_c0_seq1/g.26793  ORF comp20653_c0_seq1/g.26793 comp20653_c0_seq1/m.26793 type:complete len:1202 (-) comp20653_c0_seq1:441-4046(-)